MLSINNIYQVLALIRAHAALGIWWTLLTLLTPVWCMWTEHSVFTNCSWT